MANKADMDFRVSPFAVISRDDFHLEIEDFPTIAEAARIANEKYFAPKDNSHGAGRSEELNAGKKLASSEGSLGSVVIGGAPLRKDTQTPDDERINQMAQAFFRSPKGRKFSEDVI